MKVLMEIVWKNINYRGHGNVLRLKDGVKRMINDP